MSVKVQRNLPAKAILERESIFTTDEDQAVNQDTRSLEILILDLMPIKEETKTQFLWVLSDMPLQVDYTFLILSSHIPKNTSASHLNKFYVTSMDIRKRKFDGMIITGTPVEHLEYEEMNYRKELSMITEWAKTHVTSAIHICWGARAGLYYHYGIPKYRRDRKLSGIYRHRVLNRKVSLMWSMDGYTMTPHSRYTEVRRGDIEKHPELVTLVESPEANIFLVAGRAEKQVFVQGHPEYDKMMLNGGYHRDLAKGISPEIPCNHYKGNDSFTVPVLCQGSAANTLYISWLNFYAYQGTPYNLDKG